LDLEFWEGDTRWARRSACRGLRTYRAQRESLPSKSSQLLAPLWDCSPVHRGADRNGPIWIDGLSIGIRRPFSLPHRLPPHPGLGRLPRGFDHRLRQERPQADRRESQVFPLPRRQGPARPHPLGGRPVFRSSSRPAQALPQRPGLRRQDLHPIREVLLPGFRGDL
jgi:hypothetical protein